MSRHIMTGLETHVKKLVSKKKRRYIDNYFNLDLSCEFSEQRVTI